MQLLVKIDELVAKFVFLAKLFEEDSENILHFRSLDFLPSVEDF